MKYLALDLETTGLFNEESSLRGPDKILQLSMVVEDSNNPTRDLFDLPHFTCFVDHKMICGEVEALAMNDWILKEVSDSNRAKKTAKYPIYHELAWLQPALKFLQEHFSIDRITIAGKNVSSYDAHFLPTTLVKHFRHKVIDVGSVFVNWTKKSLPSMDELNKAHNLVPVAHDAYYDALNVIALLRTTYPKSSIIHPGDQKPVEGALNEKKSLRHKRNRVHRT